MKLLNEFSMRINATNANEAFVRNCVTAFCYALNPTVSECEDIKTSVSEAYTNCVVHAYGSEGGQVDITVSLYEGHVNITVRDFGHGIADINRAKQPFFTTKPQDERSGMGFTIIESFMDNLDIMSSVNGTTVTMTKNIGGENA